jgi:hypothetical protein
MKASIKMQATDVTQKTGRTWEETEAKDPLEDRKRWRGMFAT